METFNKINQMIYFQLTHHFELGNDSGSLIPKETYSESTTKSDFPVKPQSKVRIERKDREREREYVYVCGFGQ